MKNNRTMEMFINNLRKKIKDKQSAKNAIKLWDKKKFNQNDNLYERNLPIIKKDIRNKIRDIFDEKIKSPKRVVYAYFYKNRWLYIGKGKSLSNSILRHYLEAHKKDGTKNYKNFFSKRKYNITIYYKEINYGTEKKSEAMRIILERLLITSIQPEFERLYPTRK